MNRAVIVICDSLRPDLITPHDARFLTELGQRSARFANHAGVFPSTTRTSAASITTGCLPARHGRLAQRNWRIGQRPCHGPLSWSRSCRSQR